MSEAPLADYHDGLMPSIGAYNAVDRMAQELPAMKYPRTPGYRPKGEENPYGAWYVKSTIAGARGKLAGKRVANKDNVCIASVSMINGTLTLEGYIPDVDATIVTRILDAGTIFRKAVGVRQPHRQRTLVTAQHRDRVQSYVDLGVEEGGELVVDGRDFALEGFQDEPGRR